MLLYLILRALLERKTRFFLTVGAVAVSVALVVTSFVTADSLRSVFRDLAVDVYKGRDFIVRGALPFGEINEITTRSVPEQLLESVLRVDGVEKAEGTFSVSGVIPTDASDEPVTSQIGGPNVGRGWTDDESLSHLYLIDGVRPSGISEFAIDIISFQEYDFMLGHEYKLVTPTGPRTFTLTGVMQFGSPDNAGLGSVISVFDTSTAAEVLGYPGQFNQISVRAKPNADLDTVQNQIAQLLNDNFEVITAEAAAEESNDALVKIAQSLQPILLVFAFMVLLVSTFIVANTFNIRLDQRIRELSLLRSIGASPRQVKKLVLVEAAVTGLLAVVVGVGLGMLGALGLRSLFSALDDSIPEGPLFLQPHTLFWAACTGMACTLISSLVPAIRASRMSPIAGLHGYHGDTTVKQHRTKKRVLLSASLAAIGLSLTLFGLFFDFGPIAPPIDPDTGQFNTITPQMAFLGVGAILVFIAVTLLSPLAVRVLLPRLVHPVTELLGFTGELARKNAVRNPQRTAATATPLTIGLALITLVAVVGDSLKVSFTEQTLSAVKADFFVTTDSFSGIPETLADDLQAENIGQVVAFGGDRIQILQDPQIHKKGVDTQPAKPIGRSNAADEDTVSPDPEVEVFVTVVDVSNLQAIADIGISAGNLDNFDPDNSILVHDNAASRLGMTLGDDIEVTFVNGDTQVMNVAAIYTHRAFWNEWIIDQSLHDRVATTASDDIISVKVSDIDPAEAKTAFEEVLALYPKTKLEDRQEFQETTASQFNLLTTFVYVFLCFSLLIAFMGIANTLTLSILERTSEIGLLRAVGMAKEQLRKTIRWEAASIAWYGASIGVASGLIFAMVAVLAIPDDLVSRLSIPIFQITAILINTIVFALVIVLIPSYRASRMEVRRTIANE